MRNLWIIVGLCLTACGQKGPLYLPKEEAPAQQAVEKVAVAEKAGEAVQKETVTATATEKTAKEKADE